MKLTTVMMGIALVLAAAAAVSAAEQQATVEVRGLRIVGPGEGEEGRKVRPFGRSVGVSVVLMVKSIGNKLIAFDDLASSLATFDDDKGTNLLVGGERAWRPGYGSGEIAEDGSACTVEIFAWSRPAKGSQAVLCSGELVFRTGSRTKDFTQKDVAIAEGSRIEAGAIPLVIEEVKQDTRRGAKLLVTLKANQSIDTIADIRFFDADGIAIPGWHDGRGKFTANGRVTSQTWRYLMKAETDRATIVITEWQDLETLTIPFDIKVGLGL